MDSSANPCRPEYSDPDRQSEQPVVGAEGKDAYGERGVKANMASEDREEGPSCTGLKIPVLGGGRNVPNGMPV